MEKLLIDDTEARERISVGRTKFLELLAAGEIETVRIGRRRLVVAESLDAYVARLRAAA